MLMHLQGCPDPTLEISLLASDDFQDLSTLLMSGLGFIQTNDSLWRGCLQWRSRQLCGTFRSVTLFCDFRLAKIAFHS